jgi:membrane-bound serine protease (ClpP class)
MTRYLFSLLLLLTQHPASGQHIRAIQVDGPITPATAAFIHRAIDESSREGSEAFLIRLNTPGGLLQSTRDIVSDILEAPLPVIVFVSPAGSQAGSAGTFITLAAHIAAMAPGTNIGAAHPVGMQGQQIDSVMNEKATNDAAAFIRSIAEWRNRNLDVAERAVRLSIALSDSEAYTQNVIDLIARNDDELLDLISGSEIETSRGSVTLQTSGIRIVEIERSFTESLLAILSDPNIAYILFLLGIYGLLFELYNPGAILPGVIGGISIILAFYALQTLPVNYAGIALIIFAVILFLLELKITSHGILGIGGTIALLIGSAMLIKPSSELEFVEISWSVMLFAVAVTAFFFFFVIGLGLRAQRKKIATGHEGFIGEVGLTATPLNPYGTVHVHGERWNARSRGEKIRKGVRVRVVSIDNLTITVEQLPDHMEQT